MPVSRPCTAAGRVRTRNDSSREHSSYTCRGQSDGIANGTATRIRPATVRGRGPHDLNGCARECDRIVERRVPDQIPGTDVGRTIARDWAGTACLHLLALWIGIKVARKDVQV